MITPAAQTEVVDGKTVTLATQLDQSDAAVFPEWDVVSSKTLGAYTLTLYTNGRVLVTVTATGASVPSANVLPLLYPSLS